jgi:diadenosine tetraphosphatase ApaH/serine/threonine PP2A family protein phosphatase
VRIAIFSDIHGNREAFEACLADARRIGVDRFVFLGDLVGYGPDPQWVVDTVAREVARGGAAILGNHDAAALSRDDGMTEHAARAMTWTRGTLGAGALAFLKGLPLTIRLGDVQFVHASARAPERWPYILDRVAADACLAATDARVVFVGHTHQPVMFHQLGDKPSHPFRPVANKSVPLTKRRRWVIVAGSVGQPRDQNPAAAWSLYDTEGDLYTQQRVGYDVETTQAKIAAAGLPSWLAQRLTLGR